jgi:hypothetical protein
VFIKNNKDMMLSSTSYQSMNSKISEASPVNFGIRVGETTLELTIPLANSDFNNAIDMDSGVII